MLIDKGEFQLFFSIVPKRKVRTYSRFSITTTRSICIITSNLAISAIWEREIKYYSGIADLNAKGRHIAVTHLHFRVSGIYVNRKRSANVKFLQVHKGTVKANTSCGFMNHYPVSKMSTFIIVSTCCYKLTQPFSSSTVPRVPK